MTATGTVETATLVRRATSMSGRMSMMLVLSAPVNTISNWRRSA
jgi:hypothetical protein